MTDDSDESNLTWVNGRAFRNEAREPTPKYGLTQAERAQVRERYVEAKEFRQTLSDLALAQAMELGRRLNGLKES